MKINRSFPLFFAIAVIGFAPLNTMSLAQATPAPGGIGAPPTTSEKTIPTVKLRNGPIVTAVEELSRALSQSNAAEMNVIYAPEARNLQVPDLVLRNVTGPDALRLITA